VWTCPVRKLVLPPPKGFSCGYDPQPQVTILNLLVEDRNLKNILLFELFRYFRRQLACDAVLHGDFPLRGVVGLF